MIANAFKLQNTYYSVEHVKPLRVCQDCGITANSEDQLEFFKKSSQSKYGRTTICKECWCIRNKKYYQKNKKRLLKKQKAYAKKNEERVKATGKKRRFLAHGGWSRFLFGGKVDWAWRDEENDILGKHYQQCKDKEITKADLLELLPDRTWFAITSQVRKIGLSRKLPHGVLRKCRKCGLEARTIKELAPFLVNLNYKHGYDNLCRKCVNKYNRNRRTGKPFHYVWLTKKSECKRKNVVFDLEDGYLKTLWEKHDGLCKLSNLPMFLPYSGNDWDLIGSLDRINPDAGYTKGNVRWVLNCVNTFKARQNDEFVIMVARAIADNNPFTP